MTHAEHEDRPWTQSIPDHPRRTESAEFRAAKQVAHKILATMVDPPYGPGPWQMHHGSSLWTWDGRGWFLVRNIAGIEWAMQFCCDPAKVDRLRAIAARHYAGWPQTIVELVRLGYHQAAEILGSPITEAAGVARWTDSIFNSCVPLAAHFHTGILPAGAGAHHYPAPPADGQYVKYDDFQLFVPDPETGALVGVTPVAPRGSGDGRVQVVYAPDVSSLHHAQHRAETAGESLVVDADHPLARAAFAKQEG